MTTAEDQKDLVARLDRIQNLTDELAKCQRDAIEQMDLAAKNLEFETAARLRDKIEEVRKIRSLKKK